MADGWIKLLDLNGLPLPHEVKRIADVHGYYLEGLPRDAEPGSFVIECVRKAFGKRVIPTYTLYYCNRNVINFVVPVQFGSLHKKLIRQDPRGADLLPGAGTVAAMIREIHAIQRGIISIDDARSLAGKRVNTKRRRQANSSQRALVQGDSTRSQG